MSGGLRAEEEAGQSRCRGWADTEFGRRSSQKSLHFPERGGKFSEKRREKGRGRRRKNRIGEWREGRKAGIREGRPAKKGERRVWQGAKRSGGRSGEGCKGREKIRKNGAKSEKNHPPRGAAEGAAGKKRRQHKANETEPSRRYTKAEIKP